MCLPFHPSSLCRTVCRFVSALSSLDSNLKQQHQAQLEDMQQAHTLALQIAVKEVCVYVSVCSGAALLGSLCAQRLLDWCVCYVCVY